MKIQNHHGSNKNAILLHVGPAARHRRAGTAYIMVLSISMIVMMIGLSATALSRVKLRTASGESDLVEAALLAHSAAERALLTLNTNAAWRTTYFHGVTAMTLSLGRGEISWLALDEADLDLANSNSDNAKIIATGTVNEAVYRLQFDVTYIGTGAPPTIVIDSWKRYVGP